MVDEEIKVLPSLRNIKTYARSASWTDRSPTKFEARPKFNRKARGALPPLQPLSVNKPTYNDWPTPGSDDLGVWLSSPMPAKGFLTPREGLGPGLAQREVELPREKLAFFNKECSKIVEYIFLGSDTVAKNRDVLLQNGVTHVLNCVGFDCPEYFKDDFVYKTLWLQDSASEDITCILYDVFDYFEDVREQGGRVFVHCRQGVSRSTSLVIAYLMWKEEQSFEDALQHVKAARMVADPNMGFAAQLLQCQKRVHASPSAVIRMYRMVPHSVYDPLHLVPKLSDDPGVEALDSRGAFIIHVPLAIYVWIGKHCFSTLAENAEAAAFQVIRYEKSPGPVVIINEGEEPSEFWGDLGIDPDRIEHSAVSQRQVQSYNTDFEIFHEAVSGGYVPPLSFSGDETATRVPVMETGWSRVRTKFVDGQMKLADASKDAERSSSSVEPSSPSTALYDSHLSYANIHNGSMKDSGIKQLVSLDPIMPSSPSLTSLESYSRPASSYASPSISPSNSDSSSSFTFSPSSSSGSGLSYLSAQPSPSGSEAKELEDTVNLFNTWPSVKRNSQFFAESITNIPTATMMLPSVDEESEDSVVLVRSCSFSLDQEDDLMVDAECENLIDIDEIMLNPDIDGCNKYESFHPCSDELAHIAEEDDNVVA